MCTAFWRDLVSSWSWPLERDNDAMSTDPARALTQFFGGRICLDFANTMDWRTSAAPQELIEDYAALLSWSRARGTLPARTVAGLKAQRARRAAEAAAVPRQ